MDINFLISGAVCSLMAIAGHLFGRVERGYWWGPAYRDDNPGAYWFYMFLYSGLGVLFLYIGLTKHYIDEEIDYTYYTAVANPRLSVQETLKLKTPLHKNKIKYVSYTDWFVQWNFTWRPMHNGRCKIQRVTAKLTAKVNLPNLVGANEEQQRVFDAYLFKLREYEQGHVDIAKNAANAIKKGISSLSEMDSCEALNTAANALGYQTLDEYRAKQNDLSRSSPF